MAELRCSACGGTMVPIENEKYNSHYIVKKDTASCLRCFRVVESTRKVDGIDFK